MSDLETRLRNKIDALTRQNTAFHARLKSFKQLPIWKRVLLAIKNEV
jgi:hypothetical protein